MGSEVFIKLLARRKIDNDKVREYESIVGMESPTTTQPALRALAQEVAGLTDTLNNLLTGIMLRADMLATKADKDSRASLDEIRQAARRAAEASASLRTLSDSVSRARSL
jgi:hypothetical protein